MAQQPWARSVLSWSTVTWPRHSATVTSAHAGQLTPQPPSADWAATNTSRWRSIIS